MTVTKTAKNKINYNSNTNNNVTNSSRSGYNSTEVYRNINNGNKISNGNNSRRRNNNNNSSNNITGDSNNKINSRICSSSPVVSSPSPPAPTTTSAVVTVAQFLRELLYVLFWLFREQEPALKQMEENLYTNRKFVFYGGSMITDTNLLEVTTLVYVPSAYIQKHMRTQADTHT